MNKKVVQHQGKPSSWARGISSDSSTSSSSIVPSPPSSELCALMGFAYRLGSIVRNNDPSVVSNNDVRREAKLLMSLSCSSLTHKMDEIESTDEITKSASSPPASTSGRITPAHSVTSTSSGSSRRDLFCFTCPSLSLDDTKGSTGSSVNATPGSMLSRTLKVDDRDAMRLSSEAMARNIIESFQKAMEWRIQSWVDSLSSVLVIKEREIKSFAGNQQEILYSNEALIVAALRKIEGKLKVLEATTAFKVMNKVPLVDEMGTAIKKQRVFEEDRSGLEEGEYVYNVIHVLEMQCSLNILTPAGNVQIDLNVPGKINGTFFSSEDNSDDRLTNVAIQLNTEMLASMIEKSSRIAVRASAEALLKGEHVSIGIVEHQTNSHTKTPRKHYVAPKTTTAAAPSPSQLRSPKRKTSEANFVSGLVVITPGRDKIPSPSSVGESIDSDWDNKALRLRIPNSFPNTKAQRTEKILQPHASSRSHKASDDNLDFATRLHPKKYLPPWKTSAVVTPLKTAAPQYIEREKGPSLPVLVEVACAAIQSRKKT